tara:strand:+ start:761 stop:1669 length:909 start_codon:yes stop_codon:yes gene_type:complete
MTKTSHMQGIFGLLPTPYRENLEIHKKDLSKVAKFCCDTGQHGIVWPVMVGEFWFLGEHERLDALDTVLETVNGEIPVVFGCSGISIPQVLLYARAAEKAGVDAVIAMAPDRIDQHGTIDMYQRLAEVFSGPIIVQNADNYAPLNGDQLASLVDEIPQIQYIKEERQPGPKHIAEVASVVSDQVKCIFGGAGGKFIIDEMNRGAKGNMPACEFGDILVKINNLWKNNETEAARSLHRKLLPLINLENHPFMRYILKRRGVFSNLIERAPTGKLSLDESDRFEVSELLKVITQELESYPILPE